jgi:hypothetical protein
MNVRGRLVTNFHAPYVRVPGFRADTSNEEQKDRDGNVALLLEFLKPFIEPRWSPKED